MPDENDDTTSSTKQNTHPFFNADFNKDVEAAIQNALTYYRVKTGLHDTKSENSGSQTTSPQKISFFTKALLAIKGHGNAKNKIDTLQNFLKSVSELQPTNKQTEANNSTVQIDGFDINNDTSQKTIKLMALSSAIINSGGDLKKILMENLLSGHYTRKKTDADLSQTPYKDLKTENTLTGPFASIVEKQLKKAFIDIQDTEGEVLGQELNKDIAINRVMTQFEDIIHKQHTSISRSFTENINKHTQELQGNNTTAQKMTP